MEVNNSTEHQSDSNSPNYCSTTIMDEETITHRWIVKKVKNVWLNLKEGDGLNTPEFQGSTKRHKWYVRLSKYQDKNLEYFSIYLYLASSENKNEDAKAKVMAKVHFSVLDKNNQPVRQLETDLHDFLSGDNRSWGFHKYLKAEDILDGTKGCVVGDQLTIDCRITVLKELDTYMTTSDKIKTTDLLLRENYRQLLESADYHDVLITSETKEFKAHKNILSARRRSPVFAAMFREEMTESIKGRITISDFQDHIVKEMLQFLYCGEIENEKENVAELLKIADKYDIKDLLEECCRIVPSILTCDNAVEILLAIPQHNPEDLKSKVMKFIAMNKLTIKKTTAFQNMFHKDSELFKELVLELL